MLLYYYYFQYKYLKCPFSFAIECMVTFLLVYVNGDNIVSFYLGPEVSCHVLASSDIVPSLPAGPLSLPGLSPPLAGFPMHAKSTVNVGSGDPPRWSSKVNMAPAVH